MKAKVFAVIGRRKQDKCVYYAIRAGASYVCRLKSRAVARILREGSQARARGKELGRIAFPSSAASFSARTDAAAERANRKSAVSEYADVPWAELADRAEKAAMLPKAEEVRSNR